MEKALLQVFLDTYADMSDMTHILNNEDQPWYIAKFSDNPEEQLESFSVAENVPTFADVRSANMSTSDIDDRYFTFDEDIISTSDKMRDFKVELCIRKSHLEVNLEQFTVFVVETNGAAHKLFEGFLDETYMFFMDFLRDPEKTLGVVKHGFDAENRRKEAERRRQEEAELAELASEVDSLSMTANDIYGAF